MAWTVIQHISSPTSNEITFSSLSLGAYQRVLLLVDGLEVGTDGAFVNMEISTGSGFNTSGYRYVNFARSSVPATNTASQNTPASGAFVRLCGGTSFGLGNASTKSVGLSVEIHNPSSTSLHKLVTVKGSYIGTGGSVIRIGASGLLEQTAAIDGLKIKLDSGTMDAGKATLYGLPTS